MEKAGYTLTLAFRAEHTSGIAGGRFVEAFRIPWLSIEDGWNCSLKLTEVPQPASRTLLFENILIDTGQSDVRTTCGITRALPQVYAAPQDGSRGVTTTRWFAGYFSPGKGGWFFDESNDRSCGSKLFSLTSSATRAEQLPVPENTQLQRVIREAIQIVNSIRYKRCVPKDAGPFQ